MASVGTTTHAPVHMSNVKHILGAVNYARKASPHVVSSEGMLGPGSVSTPNMNLRVVRPFVIHEAPTTRSHSLLIGGGCIIPLSLASPQGEDCTMIPGVSDVSCVKGHCVVHRCMPGYNIDSTGSSCLYSEDSDPILLAAQYGLDHLIPL